MNDSLHDVLLRIGAEDLRPTPEGFEAQCPMCDSRRRSFRVAHVGNNGRLGAYTCHKCHVNGSLVELLMRGYGMARDRAVAVAGDLAPGLRRKSRKKRAKESVVIGVEAIAPYRCVLSDWLVDRGYDEEWIWHYRVGLDEMTNEVVYPTYSVGGDLVGITRRVAENGQPSYHMFDFQKSKHLWGIDLATKTGETCVYVVEGQTGALGLAPVVAPCPVVASFGSNLSDDQAKLLVSNFSTIVLVYDHDKAGNHGTSTAHKLLRRSGATDLFVGMIPDDVEDTGELPLLEDPKIEHIRFRQWKRLTGWKSNVTRSISSKKSTSNIKVTAQSRGYQRRAALLVARR